MRKRLTAVLLALLASVFVLAPLAHAAELAQGEALDSEVAAAVEVAELEEPEEPSQPEIPEEEPEEEFDQVELIQEGAFPDIPRQRPRLFATRAKTPEEQFSEEASRVLEAYEGRVTVPEGVYITVGQVRTFYQRVINMSPQFFYVSSGYTVKTYANSMYTEAILEELGYDSIPSGDSRLVQWITPHYTIAIKDIPAYKESYEAAIDEVLTWVPSTVDTAGKIKAVHDWFVRNVAYNYEAEAYIRDHGSSIATINYVVEHYGHAYDAYGALVEHESVCQGYSYGIMAVLNRLGIANDLLKSAKRNHIWNLVEIDGFWYHVDATWDDPGGVDGFAEEPSTTNFLKSHSVFWENHYASDWQTASGIDRDDTSTVYDNVGTPWRVFGPAVGLALSPSAKSINAGKSFALTATTTPKHISTENAVWASSDSSIATVDSTGKVTAGSKEGSTTISCMLDGITASSTVTVVKEFVDPWKRIGGETAIDTMRLIVSEGFSSAKTVVIATNAGYKDALAAASLAGLKGAPILLTGPNLLYGKTKAEIARLGATTAIVVGGPAAVSDDVVAQLKAAGVTSVSRVWGKNAPDTSRAVAKQVKSADTVIIATSKDFADALSIAPWSYAMRAPIILTESSKTLSEASIAVIKDLGASKALIVGGTTAVPPSVKTKLTAAGLSVTRLGGSTAVETSALIAAWELEHGFSLESLGVATRTGYKDALTGAALMGKLKGPIVLVNGDNPKAVRSVLTGRVFEVNRGYIFGGESAVTALAEKRIRAIR